MMKAVCFLFFSRCVEIPSALPCLAFARRKRRIMTGVGRLFKPMLGFGRRDRPGEAPSQETFGRQANILFMRFYESVSRSSECFILIEVQGMLP